MAYTMMFYNLENLYDTVEDPKTDDDSFTPVGERRWTIDRYNQKLDNLSEVFTAVSNAHGGFPVVVGVSEVENMSVMRALAARKRLSGSHFKCIHYESNDARGIDVGVFYRSDKFKLIGSEPVKLVLRSGREYIGRNILAMWGELDGEMFAVYVCHLLSRRTGVEASAGFRRAGTETARDHARELAKLYPGIKVVIMGDMNDTPADVSLAELLPARKNIFAVREGEYFNPFWALMEEGKGTSIHENRWKLYDNIVVSQNMLELPGKHIRGLHLVKTDERHYGEIFSRNFMLQRGHPKRCYNGNHFQSGYSDHLPVLIKLDRK
jgi:endonuclease/exonuclease/phosphatase family metal-dependent hydrolase